MHLGPYMTRTKASDQRSLVRRMQRHSPSLSFELLRVQVRPPSIMGNIVCYAPQSTARLSRVRARLFVRMCKRVYGLTSI